MDGRHFTPGGILAIVLTAVICAIALSFLFYTMAQEKATHRFITEAHPDAEICVAYEVDERYVVERMWVWKPVYTPSRQTCTWGARPIGSGDNR